MHTFIYLIFGTHTLSLAYTVYHHDDFGARLLSKGGNTHQLPVQLTNTTKLKRFLNNKCGAVVSVSLLHNCLYNCEASYYVVNFINVNWWNCGCIQVGFRIDVCYQSISGWRNMKSSAFFFSRLVNHLRWKGWFHMCDQLYFVGSKRKKKKENFITLKFNVLPLSKELLNCFENITIFHYNTLSTILNSNAYNI